MNWDLAGCRVSGTYMGEFPFTGVVESSRVKYGGQVQHTVVLDEPLEVYGAVRDRVLVGGAELDQHLDAGALQYYGA